MSVEYPDMRAHNGGGVRLGGAGRLRGQIGYLKPRNGL